MKTLIISLLICTAGCGFQENRYGPQGVKGDQGIPGDDAQPCSVSIISPNIIAPNGSSLISCPNGTSSLVLNGSNGSNGINGIPGTVVTPIRFCVNSTPSYPGTFAENGFCIDHKLYAVYSANGGFMAEIPPGVYSSNGINSSCTFTVGNDCAINN